jgi:DNA-binding response OmpR family regulator
LLSFSNSSSKIQGKGLRRDMKKILIIHDYADIREPLADNLANEGYLVVPIGRPLSPDLVLLKLDKDKRAVFDEVKKQSPSLPILALTTWDGPEKDLCPTLAGVYVIKNPGFEGVKRKVAEVLQEKTVNSKEHVRVKNLRI